MSDEEFLAKLAEQDARDRMQTFRTVTQLRAENEQLRAQLAAVPVKELRQLFSGELSYVAHRACMTVVESWIDTQEVQPGE